MEGFGGGLMQNLWHPAGETLGVMPWYGSRNVKLSLSKSLARQDIYRMDGQTIMM